MNRRDILRGAIAFSVSAPATIGTLSMAIPDLYREWLIVRNRDSLSLSEEENEAQSERYISLQARILASEPQDARDVALMFLVDTDGMDSYPSDVFLDRVRQLAA